MQLPRPPILLAAVLLATPLLPAALRPGAPPRAVAERSEPSLEDLAWLAGHWREERGEEATRRVVEELWMPPRGGLMLGLNRTLQGGTARAFEYLRIEQRTDGRVVLVASPGGRGSTEFPLTAVDAAHAVFENPEHDFPRRIEYVLEASGSLTASIHGDEPGPAWTFEPVGEVR